MYSKKFLSHMSEQQQQIGYENVTVRMRMFQSTVSALQHIKEHNDGITIIGYCIIPYLHSTRI